MVLTRVSRRRLVRLIGAVACFAASAAVVALGLGPTLAQSPPAAQPAEPDPAAGGPSPAAAASIEGFRQARFGMSEPEVRQAIQRDFPAAAGRLSRTTHPREKTTVLTVTADELLPGAGPAQLFYILGHASKRLMQINVVWSGDGRSAARDEAIVAAANTLRDHFQAQYPAPPNEVVANQKVGENAFVVFRAAQAEGRMVLLTLGGVAAAGRADRTSAASALTLRLSYIRDHRAPDIFRLEHGRF